MTIQNDANIMIIAYNTHLFEDTVVALKERYLDKERREEICKRIKETNPDLVCLCEVWSQLIKESIINELHYPYYHYVDSSYHSPSFSVSISKPLGDGLLILSKFPIGRFGFEKFENLDGVDALSSKGFIYGIVCINDRAAFRVFFTHTQADDDKIDMRRKNLNQIAAKLKEFHPSIPSIVLGDLNVPGESDEYKNVLIPFLNETHLDDIGAESHIATCDPTKNDLSSLFDLANLISEQSYPARYDYALFSKSGWVSKEIDVLTTWRMQVDTSDIDCSDHYPCLIRGTLNGSHKTDSNWLLSNVDGSSTKSEDAKKTVTKHKEAYGNGVSNLVIFKNDTTDYYMEKIFQHSWNGSYSESPPDVIPPGGCHGVAFHHHTNIGLSQSAGGVVYRLIKHGEYSPSSLPVVFFGFIARYNQLTERNKVYTEIRSGEEYYGKNRILYEGMAAALKDHLTDNENYESYDWQESTRVQSRGAIEKDNTSPLAQFLISYK